MTFLTSQVWARFDHKRHTFGHVISAFNLIGCWACDMCSARVIIGKPAPPPEEVSSRFCLKLNNRSKQILPQKIFIRVWWFSALPTELLMCCSKLFQVTLEARSRLPSSGSLRRSTLVKAEDNKFFFYAARIITTSTLFYFQINVGENKYKHFYPWKS